VERAGKWRWWDGLLQPRNFESATGGTVAAGICHGEYGSVEWRPSRLDRYTTNISQFQRLNDGSVARKSTTRRLEWLSAATLSHRPHPPQPHRRPLHHALPAPPTATNPPVHTPNPSSPPSRAHNHQQHRLGNADARLRLGALGAAAAMGRDVWVVRRTGEGEGGGLFWGGGGVGGGLVCQMRSGEMR